VAIKNKPTTNGNNVPCSSVCGNLCAEALFFETTVAVGSFLLEIMAVAAFSFV